MKKLTHDFILCGIAGWCMEICFTSVKALRRRDRSLTGQSSLLMFPIYGCAALLNPLFRLLKNKSPFIRGLVYMETIFAGEYLSGAFLARHAACPWDYSRHRFHIKGLIRLDFAPFWFTAGLFFEWLLTASPFLYRKKEP
jgi:uncharacterized membrane protein